MTNQVNEVLEKIREVCDLKRLEFGCEVLCTYNPNKSKEKEKLQMTFIGEGDIDDGVDGGLYHFLRKDVEYVGDTTETSEWWTIVKIIGLPVQLNHLLWALKTAKKIPTDGGVIHWFSEQPVTYNLQKSVEDNLRSNPELLKWVHGVIIDK